MLEVIGLCIDREIPAATRNRKFQIFRSRNMGVSKK